MWSEEWRQIPHLAKARAPKLGDEDWQQMIEETVEEEIWESL